MTDGEWKDLISAIEKGNCTPFLGAGASYPLPLGDELAASMARRFELLSGTRGGLARVAQWVSLLPGKDAVSPREFIAETCDAHGRPNFEDTSQIHRALAELPLPVYVTTNYDDFMALALEAAGKPPIRETCHWHVVKFGDRAPPKSKSGDATKQNPIVFHLHGSLKDYYSMVLTEDDYLDFLTVTSVFKSLIPTPIEERFTKTRLLFLGYGLEDMTLRVVLRRIGATVRKIDRAHITVQLRRPPAPPDYSEDAANQQAQIREAYVKRLLGNQATVYWGTCQEFAKKLTEKWHERP